MDHPPREPELIEAGWAREQPLTEIAASADELWRRGVRDRFYLFKLLQRQHPQPDRRQVLRGQPLDMFEAVDSTLPGEERNLAAVRRQMRELTRVPVIREAAVMPDACPVGGGAGAMPVGTAIAAHRAILPAAHSSDICCSVRASFFAPAGRVGENIDRLVGVTRFGPGGRPTADRVHHPVLEEEVWANPFLKGLEDRAAMHLADQGDGNHFAYLGRLRRVAGVARAVGAAGHAEMARALADSAGAADELWVLVTHHGSRGLGAKVFERGMKSAGKATAKVARGIPESASWLSMDESEGEDYWRALQYVARWTRANHECIHDRFLEAIGGRSAATMGCEHNFVWQRGDLWLHGKGATPAWRDEQGRPLPGLIPLNMAAPILVTLGGDRPEALGFSPHGAGRHVSRTALMRHFRKRHGEIGDDIVQREIDRATGAVDVRWFSGKADYSESPAAYKPAEEIRRQIERFALADVIGEIEPLGCVMAGHTGDLVRARREQLSPKQIRQMGHRAERRRQRQGGADEAD